MSDKNRDSQPNPRGASHRSDQHNNMWSPDSPTLGPGDLGRADTAGAEGQGRRGAQGYGNSAEYERSNGEPERQLGVQGSPEFGVYDIGGLAPDGFKRDAAADSSDDVDFGTRHWGHGEYRGDDSKPATPSQGDAPDDGNLIDRVGQKIGQFFGVSPKV